MDKRINILFDHLNNDDLLKPDTVQTMVQISECVRDKQWDQAQQMFTEMQMTKGENEGGVWMVSLCPSRVFSSSCHLLTNLLSF